MSYLNKTFLKFVYNTQFVIINVIRESNKKRNFERQALRTNTTNEKILKVRNAQKL